jgi:hypothetical protein
MKQKHQDHINQDPKHKNKDPRPKPKDPPPKIVKLEGKLDRFPSSRSLSQSLLTRK